MSKDVFTNKEQLCQSFWQSVKEQKFKAKKIEWGSIWPHPPPPPSRLLRLNGEDELNLEPSLVVCTLPCYGKSVIQLQLQLQLLILTQLRLVLAWFWLIIIRIFRLEAKTFGTELCLVTILLRTILLRPGHVIQDGGGLQIWRAKNGKQMAWHWCCGQNYIF